MTFDSERKRVVLWGGRVYDSAGQYSHSLSDTWEWDGKAWEEKKPAHNPGPSSHQKMVFDVERKVTVLYGWGKTWTWDGQDWTQKSPKNTPTAREHHGMAYDSARKRVVLFGGLGSGGAGLDEVWEWNGEDWTHVTPTSTVRPQGRFVHSMTYDSARKRVVVVGGQTAVSNAQVLAETWEWDGSTWSLSPINAIASAWAPIAYDTARARAILLFTGRSVWERIDAKWTKDSNPTPFSGGHYPMMAYDEFRHRLVVFGGISGAGSGVINRTDTWEYGP